MLTPSPSSREIARRVRHSRWPVTELAEIYGITIETERRWSEFKDTSNGPQGGGCSAMRRVIYTEETMVLREEFHELCHVICAVPWHGYRGINDWAEQKQDGISGICEAVVLMQFERALARAALHPEYYVDVVEWQEMTQVKKKVGGNLRYLERIRRYPRQDFWRKGFARCRRVGLLDENNFPTFQWADWSKLTPDDRAAL